MGRGVAFYSLIEGTEVDKIGRVFTIQERALGAEALSQWEACNCRQKSDLAHHSLIHCRPDISAHSLKGMCISVHMLGTLDGYGSIPRYLTQTG